MTQVSIGRKIKELREYIGLTQKEISEGICTQAFISQIEKEIVTPSSEVLYKISHRLGVNINYFFEQSSVLQSDYLKEVIFQIRQYILKRDYPSIKEMIKLEEKNPRLSRDPVLKQFLLWHKGICYFYLDKNFEEAISTFDEAYKITNNNQKVHSEREIEILISKAIIYSEIKQYEAAIEVFKKALSAIKVINELKDEKIHIRIYYNMAKTYTLLGDFKSSNEMCNDGISLCINLGYLYSLGELHYQSGLNYTNLSQFQHAQDRFNDALKIFEVGKRANYVRMTHERLRKLKNIVNV